MIFRLGQEWLAFRTQTVAEVTLPRPVHRIPHRSNDVLIGLVNLRGQLQLCISLSGLLGVESALEPPRSPSHDPSDAKAAGAEAGSRQGTGAELAAAPGTRLVVLRDRERSETWVFPAEEVLGVHRLARGQMRSVSSTLANPDVSFSQAILSWQDRSVSFLDEQRVFAALQEHRAMSDDLSGFSMMDLFRMEAEERLSVLSQGLVALEGTGATAGAIEPLMRAAHSLKGAARVVGLDAAVRVSHAMEDCLVAAQKGQVALGPGGIDALLRGVDLLTQVSGVSEGEIEAWQESHAGEVEALAADLAAVQAGESPHRRRTVRRRHRSPSRQAVPAALRRRDRTATGRPAAEGPRRRSAAGRPERLLDDGPVPHGGGGASVGAVAGAGGAGGHGRDGRGRSSP